MAMYADFHVKNIREALNLVTQNDPLLLNAFKNVKITTPPDAEMLIPVEWYNAEFVNSMEEFRNLGSDLHSNEPVLGFVPAFKSSLPEPFLPAKQYHPMVPLIQLATQDGLYFDFSTQSVQILFVQNGNVQFQNNFEIETPDEFNYYLLWVGKQLNILSSDISVYLSGIVHAEDERYAVLKKYFSDIKFLSPDYEMEGLISNFPAHYFSTLLALQKCA